MTSGPKPSDAPTRAVDDVSLAVVVVAYGNAATIARTVTDARSIAGCRTVVVVDNGTDGSAAAARSAGAVVVDRVDNPGFGTSQNVGVALTDDPFVLLLNPDATVDGVAVGSGLALLSEQQDVAAVQGVVLSRRDGRPERSMGVDVGWKHLLGRALGLGSLARTSVGGQVARWTGLGDSIDRRPVAAGDVETLAATAVLVRRAAFDDVGGFDESYFLYGEDLDLCRRLRARGWRLVGLPQSWATHEDGSTADDPCSRELNWWRGTLSYAARWWNGPQFAAAMVAASMRWIRFVIRRPTVASRATRALFAGPLADRLRERHRSGLRPRPVLGRLLAGSERRLAP